MRAASPRCTRVITAGDITRSRRDIRARIRIFITALGNWDAERTSAPKKEKSDVYIGIYSSALVNQSRRNQSMPITYEARSDGGIFIFLGSVSIGRWGGGSFLFTNSRECNNGGMRGRFVVWDLHRDDYDLYFKFNLYIWFRWSRIIIIVLILIIPIILWVVFLWYSAITRVNFEEK